MNPRRSSHHRRTIHLHRGFTLVELVLNLTVLTLITGAVTTAVVMATHALPAADSPLQSAQSAAAVVEQMAGEIFVATSFIDRSARAISFTVPDRDNDGQPETILYEWSGTPGDGLSRQYGNHLKTDAATNVYEFELTYTSLSESESTTVVSKTPGNELLLGSFDSWSSIAQSLTDNAVSSSSWQAEAFSVSPPADAVELTFTRTQLILGRQGAAATATTYSVGIHPPAGKGSSMDFPATTPLGTPSGFMASSVASTYQWKPISFNADVTSSDMSNTRYWVVLKGAGANAIYAQGRESLLAPLDGVLQRWSSNSGSTWQPTLDLLNTRDLRFSVWGYYTTESISEQTTVTERLSAVTIRLRLGKEALGRAVTTVQVLNRPEVNVEVF
jgi:hypothetical protein